MLKFDIAKELLLLGDLWSYMKISNIKQSSINEAITGTGFHWCIESSTLLAEQTLTNIQSQEMKIRSDLKITSE